MKKFIVCVVLFSLSFAIGSVGADSDVDIIVECMDLCSVESEDAIKLLINQYSLDTEKAVCVDKCYWERCNSEH